jgi:hypothetical protein
MSFANVSSPSKELNPSLIGNGSIESASLEFFLKKWAL